MLVGISDAPVVLFAELVLRRIRTGIAPLPELLDESVSFLVVAQALERLQFLVGNNPVDIFESGDACAGDACALVWAGCWPWTEGIAASVPNATARMKE
jgi:hypothetical protein